MDLHANHIAIDLIGHMTWRRSKTLAAAAAVGSSPLFLPVHTPCPCHPFPLVPVGLTNLIRP